MKRVFLLLSFVVALSPAAFAAAQAPEYLPFQGYLTDPDGAPKNGFVQITFAIYSQAIGGSALYTETQPVNVHNGFFSVYIGEATPLSPSVFDTQSTLYLGVKIESDAEMSPRTRLASVPYALRASHANMCTQANLLGGLPPASFSLAWHTHTWSQISDRPAGLDDGDDDTTYSAGQGLSLTGTTFSVNYSATQKRVSNTCLPGSSIRVIDAEGQVICQSDNDTTYTAGTGLSLSGTTFAISAGGVGSDRLAEGAVGPRELADFPSGSATVTGTLSANNTDFEPASTFTPSENLSCLVSVSFSATTSVTDSDVATVSVLRNSGGTVTASTSTVRALPIPGRTVTSTASLSHVFPALKNAATKFGCRVNLTPTSELANSSGTCHVSWLCL